MKLEVREALPETVRMFVHMTGDGKQLPGWDQNGDILFQAGHNLPAAALGKVGTYQVIVSGELPEQLLPGDIWVQYGLYDPAKGGPRIALRAEPATGERYDGGVMTVAGAGANTKLTWQPAGPSRTIARDNGVRKILDFGPLQTNTACRLLYAQPEWTLLLMPGSAAATVTLQLDQLGAKGRRVAAVETLKVEGGVAGPGQFAQQGNAVTITTTAHVFGYRIRFGG